jgi:hypothetical protein
MSVEGGGRRLVAQQLAKGVLSLREEDKREGFTAEADVKAIPMSPFVAEALEGAG